MRIGIAGAGRIGAMHAAVIAEHPDVEELIVHDLFEASAVRVAGTLGAKASVAATLDDLFARNVDGFVIATATPTHAALIAAAADAGVPTMCEKPAAPDAATTRDLLAVVERTGAVVQIGFHRRFDPGYIAAREAVATGAIGALRRMHLVSADPSPPAAEFIPTSGGIFRDLAIHDLDCVRYVSGREVVEVYATGVNRGAAFFGEAGDVDECAGVLTLDDGTLATMQASRYNGNGYDCRMELAGTEGTRIVGLCSEAPFRSAEPGTNYPDGSPWMSFRDRFRVAYPAEMHAFLDLARGRRTNPCTVADSLAAIYIADALDLSAKQHRPVRIAEVMP